MTIEVNTKNYGKKIIHVDEEDFEFLDKMTWTVFRARNTFYAAGIIRKRYRKDGDPARVKMHRWIMKCPDGMQVDHKDGNGLNNQKDNLRIATHAQNSKNKRVIRQTPSGFKGVAYNAKKGLYCARIGVDGKLIHGGWTKNKYAAALKYNEMAILYFEEFACINELTDQELELAKLDIPAKRITKANSTGYRGVCVTPNTTDKIYSATIFIDGKNKYLGSYSEAKEAAVAYNEAVIRYKKPAEWLNVIPNE